MVDGRRPRCDLSGAAIMPYRARRPPDVPDRHAPDELTHVEGAAPWGNPVPRLGRPPSRPAPARGALLRSFPAVPVDRPRLRGWIHAAAVPLALAGAITVVATSRQAGLSPWPTAVFGLCLVGLYTTSSTYHLGRWSARVRFVLSRCDVAMIQLFIAGTFTPIAAHALEGSWRTWSMAVAWVIAGTGAAISASPLEAPRWLATVGFVAFGWLSVVPFTRLVLALPWEGSALIIAGGVMYSVGAVIYIRRRPDPFPRWFGFHEIFHLLVVLGSVCHWLAIWRYVL